MKVCFLIPLVKEPVKLVIAPMTPTPTTSNKIIAPKIQADCLIFR
ncbi:hypothetical protein [Mesomycoplasma ovipneumoniae]|nr:hypothetical protein [Mesomycoplasma ovipneumoniae]WNM14984.1 hypothetical protein RNM01_04535 [Mesomycoplasma ovipneumoniae]